jgi:hypothetical protein
LVPMCLGLLLSACAKGDAEWIAELESPDPHVRGMAAIGLALQSPRAARPALPVLFETVDRSDVGLEQEAAHVLSLVGPYQVDGLLAELVRDELMSDHRRAAILNALVSAGVSATGPVTRCIQGLGREQAGDLGDVLLKIGEPAVPDLVKMLEGSDDVALQNFAAFLLGKLGPRAWLAAGALERALGSSDPGVREAAAKALKAMGSPRSDGGTR